MSRRFAEIEDQLERVPTSREDVERNLAAMFHHLQVAERIRGDAPDWALTIAHQAVFSGCSALMGAHGYRPRVNGHHRTALRFAALALPSHATLFDRAELLRRQRHRTMYGTVAQVSHTDANDALELARRLTKVRREAVIATFGPTG